MRTTTVNLSGVALEVSYEYTRAYRGSQTDPPEAARVDLQSVAVRGFAGSDLYGWLTPGALMLIEEQIMEYMDDAYDN